MKELLNITWETLSENIARNYVKPKKSKRTVRLAYHKHTKLMSYYTMGYPNMCEVTSSGQTHDTWAPKVWTQSGTHCSLTGTDGADTYGHSEIQLPVQLLNSTVRMHGEPQPPPSCSLQRTVTIRCYAVALKPLCLQHPLRNSWFRWIDH